MHALRSAKYSVVASGRVAGDKVDAVWDVARQETPDPDCAPAVVVHSAAKTGSYQQPLCEAIPLFDVNVTGTLRVARWCASRNVRRLVLISGALVYGEWATCPKSETDAVKPWLAGPYAVSKWCAEQTASLVKGAGCELTILRLSSLYGAGYDRGIVQRFLLQGQRRGRVQLDPPLDDAFDLLNVSDAARAVQSAIEESQTGLWNVGGGSLTTIQEVAQISAAQVNAQVDISDTGSSRPARIINWVDDGRARKELGHRNRVSLDLGIAEVARSLR